MPRPTPFTEVDSGDVVVRLVLLTDAFIPPGARLPTRKAFDASTDDKDEARRLGRPVAVTVWNRRYTTVPQARALMRSEKERAAFGLRVGDVSALGTIGGQRCMRVIASPLTPPEGPGSDGHCGIEGCDRPPQRPRIEHNGMLDVLAEKFFPVDD